VGSTDAGLQRCEQAIADEHVFLFFGRDDVPTKLTESLNFSMISLVFSLLLVVTSGIIYIIIIIMTEHCHACRLVLVSYGILGISRFMAGSDLNEAVVCAALGLAIGTWSMGRVS